MQPQRVTSALRGEKPRSSRRSNGLDERATVHRLRNLPNNLRAYELNQAFECARCCALRQQALAEAVTWTLSAVTTLVDAESQKNISGPSDQAAIS